MNNEKIKYQESNKYGTFIAYDDRFEMSFSFLGKLGERKNYTIKYNEIKKILLNKFTLRINELFIMLDNNEKYSFWVNKKNTEEWKKVIDYINEFKEKNVEKSTENKNNSTSQKNNGIKVDMILRRERCRSKINETGEFDTNPQFVDYGYRGKFYISEHKIFQSYNIGTKIYYYYCFNLSDIKILDVYDNEIKIEAKNIEYGCDFYFDEEKKLNEQGIINNQEVFEKIKNKTFYLKIEFYENQNANKEIADLIENQKKVKKITKLYDDADFKIYYFGRWIASSDTSSISLSKDKIRIKGDPIPFTVIEYDLDEIKSVQGFESKFYINLNDGTEDFFVFDKAEEAEKFYYCLKKIKNATTQEKKEQILETSLKEKNSKANTEVSSSKILRIFSLILVGGMTIYLTINWFSDNILLGIIFIPITFIIVCIIVLIATDVDFNMFMSGKSDVNQFRQATQLKGIEEELKKINDKDKEE